MAKLIYLLFLLYYLPTNHILADDIIKEKSLTTSQGKTLTVKCAGGDVNITSWNKDEAYVKITGNDKAKKLIDFQIEEKNGDIFVMTKKSTSENNLNNISYKIEVSIPSKFNAEVSTAGGDISLGDLTGKVELKTAGGNIDLKSINGNAELKTAGGDISVESSIGEIEANTAGGNIKIKGSSGKIEAKTAGGDITVNYTGENEGIELKTAGGNVYLYMQENIKANIYLKTSSGTIDMGFDYKGEINKSKTKIEGKINGGGNQITCKTAGGDIVLKKIN